MDRLHFVLPDFVRISWASDQARSVWEPRMQAIGWAWHEIEWLSVVAGLRRCCVTSVAPEELVSRANRWVQHGLNILPIELQAASNYAYSANMKRAELGQPYQFRIVLGAPTATAEFARLYDERDDVAMGRLLGYPDCCQNFFRDVWVEQRLVDTTWPMAQASVPSSNGKQQLEVNGPPEANILWRWMGMRTVPHLPCRFDCPATVRFGRQLIDIGRQHGFDQEMDRLLEILDWPVEWSALHGIAEIKTPILKVSTRTDATKLKYTVQRPGGQYPAEGAQGLRFPYQQPAHPLLTQSTGFQRGLSSPISLLEPVPSPAETSQTNPAQPTRPGAKTDQGSLKEYPVWYVTDNGFSSRLAMDNAHRPIVDLAVETLAGQKGNVLDLGCGNGALLKKIYEVNELVVPYGLEFEQHTGRIEHARELLPSFAGNFMAGNMFSSDLPWPESRRYDLAILMPGRLLEVDSERAAWLKAKLQTHCDQLLVYAYGDWLARYGNLANLAQQAGLTPLDADPTSSTCLARLE